MSKDIKKALEHCNDNECVGCPNNEELGSGDIVCRGRLLSEVLEYVADLEAKLVESEKQIKDAREAGNMAVDSWCKNRRKYEAQIAEMQNKSFILYSMLYETLEKQGCDNVASQIDQMTGWTYDKEADWLKGNRNYDQLKQQLVEKEQENERLKEEICKYEITLMDKNSQLTQQLHDLPKKIVEYFYDEIRHRAILEDDYCPDHNLERKYGVRKCLLEDIRTTILKKFGGEDE